MRRRLFWLLAIAGFVWLWLRSGGRRPQPVVHTPPGGDPADRLRRKLDESKDRGEAEAPPAEGPAGAKAVASEPPAPAVSEDLDAKRREIHERARSAAEEMRHSNDD